MPPIPLAAVVPADRSLPGSSGPLGLRDTVLPPGILTLEAAIETSAGDPDESLVRRWPRAENFSPAVPRPTTVRVTAPSRQSETRSAAKRGGGQQWTIFRLPEVPRSHPDSKAGAQAPAQIEAA